MVESVKILGVAGSLRAGSYNRGLLKAALGMLPAGTDLEIAELHGIPVFNQDDENHPPKPVREFKDRVRRAEALLLAVPEYNYGVAGSLKNAIDWGSRPPTDNVWQGKPVGMVSASSGMLGGARAQYQMRQTFVTLDMVPIHRPEVFVSFADTKFNAEAELTDPRARELVRALLEELTRKALELRSLRH